MLHTADAMLLLTPQQQQQEEEEEEQQQLMSISWTRTTLLPSRDLDAVISQQPGQVQDAAHEPTPGTRAQIYWSTDIEPDQWQGT